jgi:methylmalonyl-CoA/ethylmalonyl-CoA epimerase
MGARLVHIGIAVRSLEDAAKTYATLLGVDERDLVFEENEAEGVKIAFVELPNCRIELLEPTQPESAIAKFLEAKGEGIHHLCFEADGELDAECERLKANAFRIVSKKEGEHFFVHPKDCKGSLIEFYSPDHS